MAAKKKNTENEAPAVISFPNNQSAIMFGSLIKERRKAARLSQKDFAEMMHVTRNTVINWEADKSKPDYNLIPSLCMLLNIKVHELFHMRGGKHLDDLENRVVGNLRLLSSANRNVVDRMASTMVDEELLARDAALKESFAIFLKRPGSLAAGVGNYVPDEVPEYVFLRKNHINARADGIALVDGDSMEPVYHSGDYVYYKEASSADPGEDVVVDTEEGAVIKRVGNDRSLYSVNPAFPYPKKNDDNTIIIRGRVLGVVSSSDRPAKENEQPLQALFADEIRKFNIKHG